MQRRRLWHANMQGTIVCMKTGDRTTRDIERKILALAAAARGYEGFVPS